MDTNGMMALISPGMTEEIRLHAGKVQELMEEGTALLIAGNVNVFYLTGRFFRGYVWLPKEGLPVYFVVRPQVFASCSNVVNVRKPELIPGELERMGVHIPKKIGIEEDILSYSEAKRLMNIFPDAHFFNGTPYLRSARMVKTPYEIEQMKADGEKQVRVYEKISGLYRRGMTDLQLQIAIERELRLEGCLGYARVAGNLMEINLGSVLAGDNADNPSPYEFAMGGEGADPSLPGGANGSLIREGETVMIDMNGAFNAYQTDMTRVWTAGDLAALAYKAQECSREILRTLELETRPGMEIREMYIRATEIVEKAGLQDYFMGHSQKSGFIGHGVGIELNEQPPITPKCTVRVQEGMTLAIEPKFVLPGIGAAGVENTYVVRREGLENLTPMREEIMRFISTASDHSQGKEA